MRASLESFELPLARPLVTATDTIDHREGYLLEVHADGYRGVGEATPLAGWTESTGECLEALEGAVQSIDDRDRAFERVEGRPAARHALSLALLDLEARRAGEPLHAHLDAGGASVPSSILVNATVGDGTVEETVEEACAVVAEGFDCVKIKVGARSPGVDAARLRAVEEETGDAVSLRADANGAWALDDARRVLESTPGIEYLEQPLAPDELSAHASLRAETSVALDETLVETSITEVLEAEAADVVILKPMALGGLDRAVSAAGAAAEAGVDPVVTSTIDGVVARTAAIHLAAALGVERACGLATAERLVRDLGPDPAPVEGGRVPVPDGPGLGVRPDR